MPSNDLEESNEHNSLLSGKRIIGFLIALSGLLIAAGVVTMVGKPAIKLYRQKAIIAQGIANLDQIAQGIAVQYSTRDSARQCGMLPQSNEWTPAGSNCDNPDSKFAYMEQDWSSPSWVLMDFNPQVPTYFSYRVQRDAQRITLEAKSDPLCDGQEVIVTKVLLASDKELCAINATAEAEVQGPEE